MKKISFFAILLSSFFVANAQTEVLKIIKTTGEETVIAVSDIQEMTFATETANPAQLYAGIYDGTQSVNVGGMYDYSTNASYTITANEDGTITVSIPQYSLVNTMMGDLEIGAVTIPGLEYDDEKGGFYRMYGADGIQQHFLAVKDGNVMFNKDYTVGGESSILVKLSDNTLSITNPFKLGNMPFPLTGSFTGSKR
ncbi:MAG: calycin-like domain-containing protein [Candidatus Amulumruptor caecigallinarius]|nr:calycin-like domain-containing protein [Candidatus Amulumruptor caecigallinarius]